MEATLRLAAGADPIESIEWLRDFGERFIDAWKSHDPEAVAACVTEDVIWEDPGLPEPARGRDDVAAWIRALVTASPDFQASAQLGEVAISADGLVAYAPWQMTGTNTGPTDPPGFAPTGRSWALEGVDLWSFRGGLIWRYRALYDSTDFARQLGLMPPSGSRAERALVSMQRLRASLPF